MKINEDLRDHLREQLACHIQVVYRGNNCNKLPYYIALYTPPILCHLSFLYPYLIILFLVMPKWG